MTNSTTALAGTYTEIGNHSYPHHTTKPSEDAEDIESARALFGAVVGINRYYLWILFALGFPGNLAAAMTARRMKSSIGSLFPLFLVTLALTDSLALVIKLLYYQLLDHHVDMGDVGCCLLRFCGSWTTAFSCWILVLMALERCLAVRFPRATLAVAVCGGGNVGYECHKASVKILGTLALVGLVLALIYMPLLWTIQVVNTAGIQCQYKPDYSAFMTKVYTWVTGATVSFLPFCLLTSFNLLFVVHVRRRRSAAKTARGQLRTQQDLLSPSDEDSLSAGEETLPKPVRRHSSQMQVNIMLLSATVVFVVFTFPICLYMVVDAYWSPAASPTQGFYTSSVAVKFLCQQIAFVLVDSMHAVKFYLYFLSARRFRRHFIRLVACNRSPEEKRHRGCNSGYGCVGDEEFPAPSRNKQSAVKWHDGGGAVELKVQCTTMKSPTADDDGK